MPSAGFKPIALLALALVLLVAPIVLGQNASANRTTNATASANASLQANASAGANASANVSAPPVPTPKPAIEIESSFFTRPGERSEVRAFTYRGSKYYMLLVNGKESVIFDSTPKLVSDEAAVKEASSAYIGGLDLPFKQSNVDSLKSDFKTLKESYDNCNSAYYNFTKGVRFCFIISARTWPCNVVYDLDLGTLLNLSFSLGEARRNVNGGFSVMNSSLLSLSASVTDLDNSFAQLDFAGLAGKLQAVKDSAAAFRTGYNNFSNAHSKLVTIKQFATDGGLNRCSMSTTALAAIETSAGIVSQIPSADALTAQVLAFTKERGTAAAGEKAAHSMNETLADFTTRYTAFRKSFEKVNNLQPTYFTNSLQELRQLIDRAKAGNGTEAAQKQFEEKYAEANAALARSNEAVGTYAEGSAQIINASRLLAEAVKKYGTGDSRLQEAEKQLKELKASFELREADMKAGRPAATRKDFESINANATALSTRLASLGRPENELDIVMVAGGVLIILALVGVVIYLRHLRRKQQGLQ